MKNRINKSVSPRPIFKSQQHLQTPTLKHNCKNTSKLKLLKNSHRLQSPSTKISPHQPNSIAKSLLVLHSGEDKPNGRNRNSGSRISPINCKQERLRRNTQASSLSMRENQPTPKNFSESKQFSSASTEYQVLGKSCDKVLGRVEALLKTYKNKL